MKIKKSTAPSLSFGQHLILRLSAEIGDSRVSFQINMIPVNLLKLARYQVLIIHIGGWRDLMFFIGGLRDVYAILAMHVFNVFYRRVNYFVM